MPAAQGRGLRNQTEIKPAQLVPPVTFILSLNLPPLAMTSHLNNIFFQLGPDLRLTEALVSVPYEEQPPKVGAHGDDDNHQMWGHRDRHVPPGLAMFGCGTCASQLCLLSLSFLVCIVGR